MRDVVRNRFASEWHRLVTAARALDGQTVFVLTASALLIVIQFTFGSRRLFRQELAHLFPEQWQGVLAWGWWFSMQGITGFVIPVLCLLFLFRRTPAEIGLGKGDWRLALAIATAYLPLVTIGTWVLSADPAFQRVYPHYQPAAHDWRFLAMYEVLYLFYWLGWEYLWRGFVLFGTKPVFGLYSIFVQMVPFSILHLEKPPIEWLLSVVGGILLGALVWRCRSFWIAVPIHATQMFALDLWCTLRIRTGINGTSPAALIELFRSLGGT